MINEMIEKVDKRLIGNLMNAVKTYKKGKGAWRAISDYYEAYSDL